MAGRWVARETTKDWATALPNEVNDATWQDVCDRFWAKPEERMIVMLHTWNWIAAPDGPFVHENRAIPFLRAGLRVPAREQLDADAGQGARSRPCASRRATCAAAGRVSS